jgi:hypothetical protein
VQVGFLMAHLEMFVIGFFILEKIVKLTPTKYDDIVFDMLLSPIAERLGIKKKADALSDSQSK